MAVLLSSAYAEKLRRVRLVLHASQATAGGLDGLLNVGNVLEEERFTRVPKVVIHILGRESAFSPTVLAVMTRLVGFEAHGARNRAQDTWVRTSP